MKHIVLALFIGMTSISVQAQTYPDYTETYVNDFADLLPDADEERIRAKLKELREERDIEFTVVTIGLMSDYGYVGEIEPFATGLFNFWGVGNAERNDGVMMLVSRFDRKMRIEVGSVYGTAKNAPMQEIVDEAILPRFKRDNYVTGIESGVDAVIYDLTGSFPGEYDANLAQKVMNRGRNLLEWLGGWIFVILAPLLTLPLQAYRRWSRNKPRICPNDGTRMVRLDEGWDDKHLQKGQITEEELKSVDYDVWECPKCDHVTVEAYKAWFSRYSACRTCGYRTVEGETEILEAATTSSTGRKRIDYHCLNCDERWHVIKTIPRKSSSSSSSSGSFGGGSSSGGGASGSW
ncbi:TPM domain-containing protein [Thalassovita sp.]|uniref:TPM domain-containing protein n=1 Tax=Thalassovita sp. TaxID=1979401 RepID=UPI002B272473|nr:TPM domain-containing protein [Thalassovita sp.]